MHALGIDVGTTRTSAASWRDGRVDVLPLGRETPWVPTVALLTQDDTLLVGEPAKAASPGAPDRSAWEFTRRFGDALGLLMAGRQVGADWLVTRMLQWVLAAAADQVGEEPGHVAVTVAGSWRDHRVDLLRQVSVRAGIPANRLTLVPVPIAAWMGTVDRHPPDPGTLLGVYDLGGATFEASLLRVVPTGLELVGTSLSSSQLAGADVDRELLRHVTAEIGDVWRRLDHGEAAVRTGVHRLRRAVVAAKETLSVAPWAVVPVELPGITTEVTLTRAQLEVAIEPLLLGTLDLFERCLQAAGLAATDLDSVLLIGGGSRMPLVRSLLSERLAAPIVARAEPEQAVSLGAAVAAGTQLARPAPAPTAAAGPACLLAPVADPLPGPSTGPDPGPGPTVVPRPAGRGAVSVGLLLLLALAILVIALARAHG